MPSRCITIRIEESADDGVIISALAVIKFYIGIVVIATVADGVLFRDGCGVGGAGGDGVERLAVGVVGVAGNLGNSYRW